MLNQTQVQVYDLQEYRDVKTVVAANIRSFIKSGSPRARYAMHVITNAVIQVMLQGVRADLVAWGCRKCGEIFGRWEKRKDDSCG